jgi:hypothetical protein
MRTDKSNSLGFALLILGLAALCAGEQSRATEAVQEQSSVSERTTTQGDPTIIQHIDSKMEPTVVQSRTVTDSATGEKQKVVEPIIMERHDKVLDTTIIQPQVTELRKSTEQVVTTKEPAPVRVVHSSSTKTVAVRKHIVHRPCVRHHRVASATSKRQTAMASTKQIRETTEVIQQPSIKETFIQNTDRNAAPEPQVIQRVESK